MRLLLAVVLGLTAGCGAGDDFEDATLVEGRGVEPGLIVGTTTLSQAASTLGLPAQEPSTLGIETEVNSGPLRMFFVAPEGGGEPVLHHIRATHIPNPDFPQYEGATGRGISLLDPVEKMRSTYGEPAAVQVMTDAHIMYYPSGVVFRAEHPDKITGYDGPAPTPTSMNITSITVTPPFQVLSAPKGVSAGQLQLTMAPSTTLRVSVW